MKIAFKIQFPNTYISCPCIHNYVGIHATFLYKAQNIMYVPTSFGETAFFKGVKRYIILGLIQVPAEKTFCLEKSSQRKLETFGGIYYQSVKGVLLKVLLKVLLGTRGMVCRLTHWPHLMHCRISAGIRVLVYYVNNLKKRQKWGTAVYCHRNKGRPIVQNFQQYLNGSEQQP